MLPNIGDLFIAGARAGIADIVGHRSRKEERDLRHNAQALVILVQVKRANSASIDQKLTTLKFVEARHQAGDAGFTRAGVSHESDRFLRSNLQVEVCQHRLTIIVAEKHLFELNCSLQAAYGLLIFLMYTRFRVAEAEDTFAGRQSKLELAPEGRDAGNGKPHDANALQEKKPVTRRDAVIQRVQPTEVDDDDHTDVGDQRSEEHTSELQSPDHLVCRLL